MEETNLCGKCNKQKLPTEYNPLTMAPRETFCNCGRPTIFTKELGDKICEDLALGISMRSVTKEDWCPSMATIFRWIRENKEFQEQYARAKEESTDAMSEDLLDIADDSTNDFVDIVREDGSTFTKADQENIQRARLRVDTRKWLMSKMKPKKYGDKMDVTSDGKAIKGNGIMFSNFKDETDSQ